MTETEVKIKIISFHYERNIIREQEVMMKVKSKDYNHSDTSDLQTWLDNLGHLLILRCITRLYKERSRVNHENLLR